MGFTEALLLVFITLKLMGYIDWSWWWVLSPLWASLFIAALVVLIYLRKRNMLK